MLKFQMVRFPLRVELPITLVEWPAPSGGVGVRGHYADFGESPQQAEGMARATNGTWTRKEEGGGTEAQLMHIIFRSACCR